jgi:hypothetical protein
MARTQQILAAFEQLHSSTCSLDKAHGLPEHFSKSVINSNKYLSEICCLPLLGGIVFFN